MRSASALVVVAALVAAGCSLGGPSTARPVGESDPPDSAAGLLPIESAIADAAGFTPSDVVVAVNDARFDRIVDCMTSEGWEFSLGDLPSPLPPDEAATLTGDQTSYYIDLVTDASPDDGGEGAREDRSLAFEQAEAACWNEAEEAFPDPTAAFARWTAAETSDIEARVIQDDRVIAAARERRRCLAAQGYRADGDGRDGVDELSDRSAKAFEEFRSGVIDREEALDRLQGVAIEEEEYNAAALPCYMAESEVLWAVRAEYEREWMRENGDKLALAADEFKRRSEMYVDFLSARRDR